MTLFGKRGRGQGDKRSLVLQAFAEPRPLAWMRADKHRDGTMAHAKLDEAAVLALLARRAQGDTYKAIARHYGVTKITCVERGDWKDISAYPAPGPGQCESSGTTVKILLWQRRSRLRNV
jgi:hypothetical protein